MGGLVGSSPVLESSIGLEEVERGTLKLLIDNLNDEIIAKSDRWREADLEWQALVNSGPAQVDVESVPIEHFHEGPHQSIIMAPPENFPAVSVMCYYLRDVPSLDQFPTAALRLFIESFVQAGPVVEGVEDDFEAIVHRRALRTTEAINAVIMRDRTLCGTAKPGVLGLPTGGLGGQSWVQNAEQGSGPRHLWQGSRLEFNLQRQMIF